MCPLFGLKHSLDVVVSIWIGHMCSMLEPRGIRAFDRDKVEKRSTNRCVKLAMNILSLAHDCKVIY